MEAVGFFLVAMFVVYLAFELVVTFWWVILLAAAVGAGALLLVLAFVRLTTSVPTLVPSLSSDDARARAMGYRPPSMLGARCVSFQRVGQDMAALWRGSDGQQVVEAIDTTTREHVYIRAFSWCRDAHEALAASFGMTKEQYVLDRES